MTQEKVTLNEIITAVRELTFDRFVIPAFAIKAMEGTSCDVIPSWGIKLTKPDSSHIEVQFAEYDTLEKIVARLIELGVVVAYTPYFRGTETPANLIPVTSRDISLNNFTAFRKNFFSDDEIKNTISWYYFKVLDIPNVDLDNPDIVGRLKRPSERHMALWCAYHIVEKRRLYESAASAIGQSFTDGTDYSGAVDQSNGMGTTTTTTIGSVFSITEDPTRGYFYEDFNRVGSDNVLGDRYSFWYKLQLWIRDELENTWGDYSLRKDSVIPGYVSLTRELDFRSYFDSYPFTLSPLSRGILSKT